MASKYTVFLLYTSNRIGTWHYVFGTEPECRVWIAKHIENPNARYRLISRHSTLAETRQAVDRYSKEAKADPDTTYVVNTKYAYGSTPKFLGDGAIVAHWRGGNGQMDEDIYLTQLTATYALRTKGKIIRHIKTPRRAFAAFDELAAN